MAYACPARLGMFGVPWSNSGRDCLFQAVPFFECHGCLLGDAFSWRRAKVPSMAAVWHRGMYEQETDLNSLAMIVRVDYSTQIGANCDGQPLPKRAVPMAIADHGKVACSL